jgi:hypothetical protein
MPAVALIVLLAGRFASAQDLQIQAIPTEGAVVGQNYSVPIVVNGGTAPYTWHLAGGNLPTGLKLQAHTGIISGVPTTPGEYHFTVKVVDSSTPGMEIQREFTIRVIAGLAVTWQDEPKIHGNTISGSVMVMNQTPEDFDLTVVIVAVNQIGRATTLGYQHFTVPAHSASQVIPFGSSPGPGTYYVRVDAVGHHPGHHHIYRASLQTPASLTVTQF